MNFSNINFMFLILTETCLNDYKTNELGIINYNYYRCDRSIYTSVYKRSDKVFSVI